MEAFVIFLLLGLIGIGILDQFVLQPAPRREREAPTKEDVVYRTVRGVRLLGAAPRRE